MRVSIISALGVPAIVARPICTVRRGFAGVSVLMTRVRVLRAVRGAESNISVPARTAVLRVARALDAEFCGAVARGVVVVRVVAVPVVRATDEASRTAEYAGAPAIGPIIAHKIRILFISATILSKIQKWVKSKCEWLVHPCLGGTLFPVIISQLRKDSRYH